MVVDPVTPEEWQEAVDAAHACLALDAARQYGFVTGGPTVVVHRCELILVAGRARGFTPRLDAVERFVEVLRDAGREDSERNR